MGTGKGRVMAFWVGSAAVVILASASVRAEEGEFPPQRRWRRRWPPRPNPPAEAREPSPPREEEKLDPEAENLERLSLAQFDELLGKRLKETAPDYDPQKELDPDEPRVLPQRQDSPYLAKIKTLLAQAKRDTLNAAQRGRDPFALGEELLRYEQFTEAARAFYQLMNPRSSREKELFDNRETHLWLAQALILNDEKNYNQLIDSSLESAKESPLKEEDWWQNRLTQVLKLRKGFSEAKKKILPLIERGKWDVKAKWELCELYHQDCPYPCQELICLIEMQEWYPEAKAVESGEVHWRIANKLKELNLPGEALAIFENMPKLHPPYWAVRDGDYLYRAAQCAAKADRKGYAVALLEELKRRFPKHRACQPRKDRRGDWIPALADRLLERWRR